jgi:hypothetical protein
MLTTDEFDKAKQKFKSLYSQLQHLIVKFGQTSYKLKGEYEAPAEERKFTAVVFSFDPTNDTAVKLKIELTLQYIEPMEWKVKLLVYDREREDDERGKIVE